MPTKLTPSMRRIVNTLNTHGDLPADDISELAHVCAGTLASGYLAKLQILGLVRVSCWQRNTVGPPIATYSTSVGRNQPKPVPYTSAEKSKRWRKRAGYYKPEYERYQQTRHALNALLKITSPSA